MRWLKHHLTPLLGYSLLTIVLTYPLIGQLDRAVPHDLGDPLLNTWILAWVKQALLTAPSQLFQANIYWPTPNTLAYSEHLISTALLLFPLPMREPLVVYNLSLLLTFPLAGYGMYLLVLHWTHHRTAAILAGLAFAFAPYRFAAISHLQLLTFQWMPFILLTLSPKFRRHIALLPIFLTAQLLTSWYLAVYTLLIVGVYLLFEYGARMLPSTSSFSRKSVLPLAGGGWEGVEYRSLQRITLQLTFVGLLVLPFALPYISLLRHLREARPLSLALSLAAQPTDFLSASPFNTLWAEWTAFGRSRAGFTDENLLFVGLIGPLLAMLSLLALFDTRQRRRVGALLAVLLVTVSLTFAVPYQTLATLLPPTTIIRVPPRWIIPALFALVVLVGVGFAHLLRRWAFAKRYETGLAILCGCILISESLTLPLPIAPVENQANLPPIYQQLVAQTEPFVLLELPLHYDPEFPEVKRMYASTLGWWPLLNGYSGHTPPRQAELARVTADFPDPQAVATLAEFHDPANQPLLITIHPGEQPLDRTQWEMVDRWQAQRQAHLCPLVTIAGDELYRWLEVKPARFELLARFEGGITLYRDQQCQTLIPDQLVLYWQVEQPITESYTVFVHFRAEDGFVRAQADGVPGQGHYPTDTWDNPAEWVQDLYPRPEVDYHHIAVGLYDPQTGQRLTAETPSSELWPDGAVMLLRK